MVIKEIAYAKINLTLRVGKERPDHYHDISSLMVPIELNDILEFEKIDSGIILLDNTTIKNTDNFVYKAAKLFLETYKIDSGVKITLLKNIPAEAGLGGGSSDAAATLRGMNRLFELDKTLDELANLAVQLGSDMPFCVYQQFAYCTEKGNNVCLLKQNYKKFNVLVIKPPFSLSTKKVYDQYKFEERKFEDSMETIINALSNGDLDELNNNLFNDLMKPAFLIEPELKKLYEEIDKISKVMMTGSGSALYCISDKNSVLNEVIQKLGVYNQYILTKLL